MKTQRSEEEMLADIHFPLHSPVDFAREMVSLCAQLLASTILLNIVWSAPTEPLARQCGSYENERVIRSIPPDDCLVEEKDGQRFVLCLTRFAVEAPLDEEGSSSRDETDEDNEERKNLTIYMDYQLKIGLHDATEAGVFCLEIISVNFEKVMRRGGEKRSSMTMPSSVFSVVANTQMFMSKTDIQQKPLLGRMEVDRDCWENIANSSCIHKIIFTSNATQPGEEDDIHRGLFDYSIFGYGYSRISAMSGDAIQTLFKETTRRGRVLLQHLPGENLTELRLPNNRWKSLNETYLPRKLPNVKIIDLSGNKFGEYETEVIGRNGILEVVNFSDSHLKKIPSFIEKQNNLYILDIGGNVFDYGDNGAVYLNQFGANMTNLRFLNISGFLTRIFDQNTLPKWIYLEKLDASKCKMVSIRKGAFDNFKALKWLDLSSNNFYTLEPTLFSNLENLEYLDLSRNKLTQGQGLQFFRHSEWPKKGMQLLNLSKTSMSTIAELIAEGSKVRKIDLSDNVLRDLDDLPAVWKEQWVLELDLSSNLISALSEDVCQRLAHVNIINLNDNRFDCSSCDMPAFKMWLNTTIQLTSNPEHFFCNHPVAALENKTTVLEAFNYIDPCRGPDYGLWVGSSMSGIALLASLVGGILYIYRFEASYVIHMIRVRSRAAKGEGKPHSECIYDAFVSYSGRDRQWVLRVLQPVLEECDQRYQLCLHDRNFPLGGIVTQNIVDSIDKSRKTLLILSENFVESQWCRWEMEMANHKLFNDSRNFLILIELDRLDRKMLPRHLRFLMETRTYLEWPEDCSISKDTLEMETSLTENIEYLGKSAEQDFWRRLQEALGDSLYMKEKKAKREAEIAIQKTKLREADVPFSAEEEYQHYKEN